MRHWANTRKTDRSATGAGRLGLSAVAAALLCAAAWSGASAAPAAEDGRGAVDSLQTSMAQAVARSSPVVVKVIVPEMTRNEEREKRREVERLRRRRQEATAPKNGEKATTEEAASDGPAATDETAEKPEAPAESDSPAEKADEGAESDEKAESKEKKGDDSADVEPPDEDAVKGTETAESQERKTRSRSGLIVSTDGYIVTSRQNLGWQDRGLQVELADGRTFDAKRLGEDLRRDVVLLKIEATGLPTGETVVKEDLAVGQWVLAVGRALPIGGPTVSKGILSAVGRISGLALQTDAGISPVNFGGALVDLRGRVVGMIAAMPTGTGRTMGDQYSDSGIGLAIPIEDIIAELPKLKAGETVEPPFLGIRFDMRRTEDGALVMDVLPGTAAKECGLEKGDIIVEFEGKAIDTPYRLLYEIGAHDVGDKVTFKIRRDGKTVDLEAVLRERSQQYR